MKSWVRENAGGNYGEPVTLEGVIERITFHNADSGYTVAIFTATARTAPLMDASPLRARMMGGRNRARISGTRPSDVGDGSSGPGRRRPACIRKCQQ